MRRIRTSAYTVVCVLDVFISNLISLFKIISHIHAYEHNNRNAMKISRLLREPSVTSVAHNIPEVVGKVNGGIVKVPHVGLLIETNYSYKL